MASWRTALVLVFVVALAIPSVLPSADGGGSGGHPPKPPGGGGPPSSGGGSGSGPGGPNAPPSTKYNGTAYKTPYADLRVKLLRANRDVVAPSQVVEFTVETENVGYLIANLVNLTLYDGAIQSNKAISWVTLDMRDFQAKTIRSWVATGVGDHTIIAFVDANNTVKEISETNNTASVVVRVAGGGGPGVPDIMVNERDIGLSSQPQAGQPTTLKVEVRNVGDVSANNVAVRVTDNGATIDSYSVGTLSTTASNVHSITWVPAVEGAHIINLTTDEANVIRELKEDNNVASVGIYVQPSPPCILSKGEWYIPPGKRKCTPFA